MSISNVKQMCKRIKKYDNPKGLTLMQIQHKVSVDLGYRNWSDLLKNFKE